MTAHEILVAARNRLAAMPWWQHGNGRAGDGTCAGLAISDVVRAADLEIHRMMPAIVALASAAEIEGRMPKDIYVWNDTLDRTKEEVLAAFDEAIRRTAPAPNLDFLTEPADAQTA